jgi:hypothetical protein
MAAPRGEALDDGQTIVALVRNVLLPMLQPREG